MESRFRRYFTRRVNSEPSQTGHALNDLDIYSIPYETTAPRAKASVLIPQLRRKSAVAAKTLDEFDELTIRACAYDSVRPGKPPILGERPYKGNGPVKLQTSRRLSTGELLTTTQDNQRTLEDIREGGYIVGRKEKRNSQPSQVKTSGGPFLPGLGSPRSQTSTGVIPPRHSSLPVHTQNLPTTPTVSRSKFSASPVVASSVRDSPPVTPWLLPPEPLSPLSSLSPHSGYEIGSASAEHIPTYAIPSTTTRARVPSSSASLHTRAEEQNATIQALWKAEYARLVAIYGQDGVDKSIAEFNRDHQRFHSFDAANGTQDHHLPSAIVLQPLPRPSFDAGWASNSVRNSHGSSVRDSFIFDDASDYSSQKPSSIMSEGSSSSYTKRTSFNEPDLLTTREDVRRVVENMRSNYLKAIESKAPATDKAKPKKKPRVRKSLPNDPAADSCPPSTKPAMAGRQTWHGNHVQGAAKPDRKKAKAKPAAAGTSSQMLNTSTSKSSLKSKSSVQRADSLTLGALLPEPPLPEKVAKSRSSPGDQTPKSLQHARPRPFERERPNLLWTNRKRTVESF